jgi:hypothetical protein
MSYILSKIKGALTLTITFTRNSRPWKTDHAGTSRCELEPGKLIEEWGEEFSFVSTGLIEGAASEIRSRCGPPAEVDKTTVPVRTVPSSSCWSKKNRR